MSSRRSLQHRRPGVVPAVTLLASATALAALIAVVPGGGGSLGASTAAALTTSTSTSTSTTSTTTSGPSTTSITTVPSSTTTSSTTTTTTTPATTTTTTLSGQQLLSGTMNAFASEAAVDWTYRLSAFGGTSEEVFHDGKKDGTMTATLSDGGQVAKTSMVLDGKVYFEGNALGLDELENLTAAVADKEAGHWIAVPRSSAYFRDYSNDLTVGSAVEELYLGGSVEVLPTTTFKGQPAFVVKEAVTSKGTTVDETIYIRATGLELPLQVLLTVDGVSGAIVYGPWGKPPAAKVPVKSVPFQSTWLGKS